MAASWSFLGMIYAHLNTEAELASTKPSTFIKLFVQLDLVHVQSFFGQMVEAQFYEINACVV